MRKKGFTLIELLAVMAILAIFAALMIPQFLDEAHGLEINKPVLATDGNVNEFIRALKHDASQTVTVMAYAAVWNKDTVDDHMDELRAVQMKLYNGGVAMQRINIHLANEAGLKEDGTPTPSANGIYISLD